MVIISKGVGGGGVDEFIVQQLGKARTSWDRCKKVQVFLTVMIGNQKYHASNLAKYTLRLIVYLQKLNRLRGNVENFPLLKLYLY